MTRSSSSGHWDHWLWQYHWLQDTCLCPQ